RRRAPPGHQVPEPVRLEVEVPGRALLTEPRGRLPLRSGERLPVVAAAGARAPYRCQVAPHLLEAHRASPPSGRRAVNAARRSTVSHPRPRAVDDGAYGVPGRGAHPPDGQAV